MNNSSLLRTMDRNENGEFSLRYEEPKVTRSVRLTDVAWQKLKDIGDSKNISRTDVIERFCREEENKQEIILKALNQFITDKKESYGENPSQKGEFKFTRAWDCLLEFQDLIQNAPWELLGEQED
ncbi:hypothetical protein [Aliterella atlantica]|uniref:Uncharacterized protein n=2 Tax=Aliterella TaxID=1827277 RepID=A0A0D8ZYS5_9CYAN|nr:hypothetical protein [Aliterella atlantica]KJH72356.1 hypothetical protein UH38_08080 [Aliterella atlantica CENA595]